MYSSWTDRTHDVTSNERLGLRSSSEFLILGMILRRPCAISLIIFLRWGGRKGGRGSLYRARSVSARGIGRGYLSRAIESDNQWSLNGRLWRRTAVPDVRVCETRRLFQSCANWNSRRVVNHAASAFPHERPSPRTNDHDHHDDDEEDEADEDRGNGEDDDGDSPEPSYLLMAIFENAHAARGFMFVFMGPR